MSDPITRPRLVAVLITCLAMIPGLAGAAEIHVAVASNFTHAMQDIVARYEKTSDNEVTLAFGSTGKHYSQIVNGAPFDAFFAADVKRPRKLESGGHIVKGSRFTYAQGRIVFWSKDTDAFDGGREALKGDGIQRLAIANPRLAPYGLAARQTLEALGEWQRLQPKVVMGENIAQTYHFVASGNAPVGFVALSQVIGPDGGVSGSHWVVPESLYEPIRQQAVILKDGLAVRDFIDFVHGPEAGAIIERYGYRRPAAE
ncbi:molybdate ABC transporter substrate-binding protein [Arhodomonas sp. KWT2]|uniref:molybdate ABC transporter substrate-binding protein n=1 Tax=Arhodomonas sp. KWT2 TaxID=3344194 RepID=UPI0035BF1E65